MTENKRFNVFDVDGTIFLEDHKEGSYHIGEIGNVDVNCLNDIADRLNELSDENEQLRKENDMFSCELSVSANKEISRNCRITELEEENKQLKQALREQLEENGNAYCIEILDKIFDLKYDEWQRKMNESHTYDYIDWEKVLNDKGDV